MTEKGGGERREDERERREKGTARQGAVALSMALGLGQILTSMLTLKHRKI